MLVLLCRLGVFKDDGCAVDRLYWKGLEFCTPDLNFE
jgi:hypothetical protein